MKVVCEKCKAVYNIGEDKIPLKTKIAKCKKCNSNIIIVGKEDKLGKILYQITPHYTIFIPSIIFILLGIFIFHVPDISIINIIATFIFPEKIIITFSIMGISIGLILFGITYLFQTISTKVYTELVICENIIIVKNATVINNLMKKNTVTFEYAKIESFSITQSIFGKIFNYGNITINGVGVIEVIKENITFSDSNTVINILVKGIKSPVFLCQKIAGENQHNHNILVIANQKIIK